MQSLRCCTLIAFNHNGLVKWILSACVVMVAWTKSAKKVCVCVYVLMCLYFSFPSDFVDINYFSSFWYECKFRTKCEVQCVYVVALWKSTISASVRQKARYGSKVASKGVIIVWMSLPRPSKMIQLCCTSFWNLGFVTSAHISKTSVFDYTTYESIQNLSHLGHQDQHCEHEDRRPSYEV